MRAAVLARHLSCKLIHPEQVQGMSRRKTIVAIKTAGCEAVRAKCERFIYDPLDDFFESPRYVGAIEYWRAAFEKLKQSHLAVLQLMAEAEDDVAATYDRLAEGATPEGRARRLALAGEHALLARVVVVEPGHREPGTMSDVADRGAVEAKINEG